MSNRFEFRFLTVLASHADSQAEPGTGEPDLRTLDQLGAEGWQIAGVLPDPLLPGAKLIVSLQREVVS